MPLDWKKEWPKLKKQLERYGQEALVLAKKGEQEAKRLSEEGKLRLKATTLGLQKERLYYQIGKEYVKSQLSGKKNAQVDKLVGQVKKITQEEKTLNRKIKKVTATT